MENPPRARPLACMKMSASPYDRQREATPLRNGPRAVLGSQRLRAHKDTGTDSPPRLQSDALRAEDPPSLKSSYGGGGGAPAADCPRVLFLRAGCRPFFQ